MAEVRSTVIYDDVATELSAQPEAGQLWIDSGDLFRATQFELSRRAFAGVHCAIRCHSRGSLNSSAVNPASRGLT